MNKPRVFISHSHKDRTFATRIQSIIEKKGAETYLDQDKIQAGDYLPEKLLDGISWSDKVILIWSNNASQSKWVNNEWKTALRYRKKIVIYRIDSAQLPDDLRHFVYVSQSDLEHANNNLLNAIFENYTPSSTDIFPGVWILKLDAFGMGTATYELRLRKNGQVTGDGKIDSGGFFGSAGGGSAGGTPLFPGSGTGG